MGSEGDARETTAAAAETRRASVVATIDVPSAGGVAAAFGSIWLPSHAGELLRVNPDTNTTEAIITVGGPGGAIAAYGSLWVTGSNELARVDPRMNRVVARVPGPLSPTAMGFGSVWAMEWGSDHIVRIDPKTTKVATRIKVGDGAQQYANVIAVQQAKAFVLVEDEDVIVSINPETNEITERRRIARSELGPLGPPDEPQWLYTETRLRQVDLGTGKVLRSIRLPGEELGAVAIARDAIVVVSEEAITHFDPDSGNAVAKYEAPIAHGGVEDAEIAFGDLWIAYYGAGKVVRVTLPSG